MGLTDLSQALFNPFNNLQPNLVGGTESLYTTDEWHGGERCPLPPPRCIQGVMSQVAIGKFP